MRSWLAHAFLPRRSNRHRPWLLHPNGLAIISTIIVGLHISLAIVLHFPIFPDVLGAEKNITPTEVLASINKQRTEEHLPVLQSNPQLEAAAQRKAEDMFQSSYWAHTSPDGQEPWDFIEESGYAYSVAGENLARNFHSTEMMVAAWMASPTHRDNILHTEYQDTGIAVVNGTLNGKPTTVVVQLFGTPEKVPFADLPDQAYATTRMVVNTGVANADSVLGAQLEVTPIHFYRAGVLIILALLLGVLTYDMLHAHRKNLRRNVSKNLAHIILLIAVITTVFLAEGGRLL